MNLSAMLDQYYGHLKEPSAWKDLLVEDFQFVGGDMRKPEPIVGRDVYVGVLSRLGERFSRVTVLKRFVNDDEAVVLAHYDWTFPRAGTVPGSVAEFWTAREGRLTGLTIFFDTLNFDRLVKGQDER